ncbi:MAG TPA: glucose-1-phosphate adenylyltransferase [Spirochaetota bacterium]|nr:glucose-1-phosphate adenylyltransferase [Spirochaetota bacterium]HOL56548.1 glucose-1-phosphate adenylyltransferase [Spirochaetota bacterium]
MKDVICLILGGGQGSRLFPLTKDRSKPAVPIGGKYRLIDIPISNCLNSGINQIFILTQFNSASLNKHINQAYRFDNFHQGFVDILAAEQSQDNTNWYQGTADAVRKNLKHILAFFNIKYVLILSGDQIYKMNFKELIKYHKTIKADLTIPILPITKEDTKSFGIVSFKDNLIVDFVEKPQNIEQYSNLYAKDIIKERFPNIEQDKEYLASMGIYLFNIEVLLELLKTEYTDFGKEIIPFAIRSEARKVGGFLFNGYWEDVGTIKSFLKANLDFASSNSHFDFYSPPVYTNARYLPGSKIYNCYLEETIIADGCIIKNCKIKNSVIGIRSIINNNVVIENSVVMGADYYESEAGKEYNRRHHIIDIGIGDNTFIKNAIIDKNARIGKNCKIVNKENKVNFDGDNYYIREGVIIVPKNGIIKDNTEI